MLFSNFREACLFYKFPGSHQVGSFGNKTGIIRSYSNGTVGKDFFLDDEATVLYRLKDEKYKEKFSLNIKHKQLVRVFRKVEAGVKDLGEYKVVSFEKSGHVKMRREKEKNVTTNSSENSQIKIRIEEGSIDEKGNGCKRKAQAISS